MDQLHLAAPASPPPDTPLPEHVTETLRALAGVLDARIAVRDAAGTGLRAVVGRHLGVDRGQVVRASANLGPLTLDLAALTLARELRRHPGTAVCDSEGGEQPSWRTLHLGTSPELVPLDVAACFAEGTLADCPLVVELDEGDFAPPALRVHARPADLAVAQAVLDGLLDRSRTVDNPYRGRLVVADVARGSLVLRVESAPVADRADVILPEAVWRAVDVNVHGVFARREQLAAAGLGTTRGLLLEGPPGTGKTALSRVVAAELLAGGAGVTVVLASAGVLQHGVDELYEELGHLAPVLVVMEDLDLVAAHRQHGDRSRLQGVLLALDGLLGQDGAIVTLATTNDLEAIDPAARRACRFDQVVHVGLPDDRARGRILSRRLAALGIDVELGPLVAATSGATGADVHEVVRRALLTAAGDLTGEHLLAVAEQGDWHPAACVGQYL